MAIQIHSSADGKLSRKEKELLHDIMRQAYAETEIEIWGENYVRMDREEYYDLIYQGSILYATIDQEICGSVYYYKVSEDVYGFSLLCAREGYKHKGVGRTLIEAVEAEAKKRGASAIQIEILRPTDFDTTSKTILRRWYEQLGYTYTSSDNFADAVPDKARLLKVPSSFDHYIKKI